MIDYEMESPQSLYAKMEEAVRSIAEMQPPSLRIVHEAERAELEYTYSGFTDDEPRWRRPDGRPVRAEVVEVGKKWLELLEAPLLPGFVTAMRGRLIPKAQPPATLSPIYLTVTASAMRTWPPHIRYPVGQHLQADLKLTVVETDGAPDVLASVELNYREREDRKRADMAEFLEHLRSHWAHFADKAGVWLADSGIHDLTVMLPIREPQEPVQLYPPQWPTRPN